MKIKKLKVGLGGFFNGWAGMLTSYRSRIKLNLLSSFYNRVTIKHTYTFVPSTFYSNIKKIVTFVYFWLALMYNNNKFSSLIGQKHFTIDWQESACGL